MITRVSVTLVDGRPRVRTVAGLLRAQAVHARPGWVRLGLVATTALLLGGDEVGLEIEVGAGAQLELVDVAGTVAYAGRGRPARWDTSVRLGEGARFGWRAEPFVVADGADVTRSLTLDAAPSATAVLRETVVLGRTDETGGPLRTATTVTVGSCQVWREDQQLDPVSRARPGLLGNARVIDSVLTLGGVEPPDRPGATRFRLPHGAGQVQRYLGRDLAASPLTASGTLPTRGPPEASTS
ncbi:MAG: urease accessory protein UreD [Actinomycetes bacterium]